MVASFKAVLFSQLHSWASCCETSPFNPYTGQFICYWRTEILLLELGKSFQFSVKFSFWIQFCRTEESWVPFYLCRAISSPNLCDGTFSCPCIIGLTLNPPGRVPDLIQNKLANTMAVAYINQLQVPQVALWVASSGGPVSVLLAVAHLSVGLPLVVMTVQDFCVPQWMRKTIGILYSP